MTFTDDVAEIPVEYQKYLDNPEEDKSNISPKMNLLNIINKQAKMKMEPEIQDSSFFAYVGERRSGKSITAIAQIHLIDPDVTTENVVFTFDDLRKAVYSKTKAAILWDESGVTAYSRDFMTNVNKLINKFMQVYGYRRISIHTTFQHLQFIDNQLRQQMDALYWCYGKDYVNEKTGRPYTRKSLLPFTVKKNPFWAPTFKPYEVMAPKMLNPEPIGWVQLPDMDEFMRYAGVKKEFLKDYDKKKQEFFQTLGEDTEPQKVDSRILKTAAKQHSALKAALKYMTEVDKLSKENISKKVGVARSTLRQWEIFSED